MKIKMKVARLEILLVSSLRLLDVRVFFPIICTPFIISFSFSFFPLYCCSIVDIVC